jgi:hypothetical protein
MKRTILILFLTLMPLTLAVSAYAAVPNQITYTGSLRSYGQPVSGNKSLTFNIYPAATGGTAAWTSGPVTVKVSSGTFTYNLTPNTVDWRGMDFWLELVVGDKILSPRTKLTAQAYALHSRTAEDIEKNTGNSIHFAIGNSTYAVISSAGFVGIGTASPGQLLSINGKLQVGSDSNPDTAGSIRWNGSNFQGYNGTTWLPLDVQSFTGGGWTENASANKVYLADSERNVGIGTTTPEANLHLATTASDTNFIIDAHQTNSNDASITLRKSRNNAIITSGDGIGEIKFVGHDGNDLTTVGAIIKGITEGTIAQDRIPTSLAFYTHPDNTSNAAERMRITSSGNVGIGTENPSDTLEVNGGVTTTYGFFHERGDYANYDFILANFITDGSRHDLDLSSIVPSGAKAIVISVDVVDDAVGSSINFYKKSWTNGYMALTANVPVINQDNIHCLTIPIGTDGKISYITTNTTFTNIYGNVIGWWK